MYNQFQLGRERFVRQRRSIAAGYRDQVCHVVSYLLRRTKRHIRLIDEAGDEILGYPYNKDIILDESASNIERIIHDQVLG